MLTFDGPHAPPQVLVTGEAGTQLVGGRAGTDLRLGRHAARIRAMSRPRSHPFLGRSILGLPTFGRSIIRCLVVGGMVIGSLAIGDLVAQGAPPLDLDVGEAAAAPPVPQPPELVAPALPAPELAALAATTPGLRTRTPTTIEELAQLETLVESSAARVLQATVAILAPGASGSGVIVDASGLVLTAGHVSGAPGRSVRVVLADGRELRGTTLGWGRDLDCGLVRMEADGPFPHVELSDEAPALGLWCVALGHPGGLERGRPPVVRIGRLLSVGRQGIRTDCSLMSGDSGGPLVDLDGRVLGIHSRIGMDLAQNYHVPAAAYREHWDRLVGGVSWGAVVLGVYTEDTPHGCLVTGLVPGLGAAQAGVLPKDVVIEVAGRTVANRVELARTLETLSVDQRIEVAVLRGRETLRFTVRLSEAQR